MSASALLYELRAAGVRVSARGDMLQIESKPGAVSAGMRDRLAAMKPTLLEMLRNGETTMRAHLLNLADGEGVDASHIRRLHADDVAACVGESDDTLRTYLRGLNRGARMDAGLVPFDWTATAHCAGCGPVWWHKAERLTACPWCFKRKAGKSVPLPRV